MTTRPATLDRALAACRILVVDDNATNRAIIKAMLAREGYGEVHFAEDGYGALEAVDKLKPDLVILDLMMPRMDGREVLTRLRATPEGRDLPVIIQTGDSSQATRSSLFQAGATDFVVKPLNFVELTARAQVHLYNRVLVRSLAGYVERVEQELTDARAAQQALLPGHHVIAGIEQKFGLSIDSHFEPSSEIGGDLWGCKAAGEGILFYLFDVTGHGVSAALDSFRLRAMIDGMDIKGAADPARFLKRLNAICHQTLPRGRFVTMTAVGIVPGTGSVTVASAGAPEVVIGEPGGGALTELDGSGLPLGICAGTTYLNRSLTLAAGSFIFLFSDGLPETRGADGHLIGVKGVVALLDTARRQPRPLESLMQGLDALGGAEAPPDDDRTAIWIRLEPR
jgi:sigma-B regulation protein RsbU (phosphoserine phosphatase)